MLTACCFLLARHWPGTWATVDLQLANLSLDEVPFLSPASSALTLNSFLAY